MPSWRLRAQAQTRCTPSHRVRGGLTIGTRILLINLGLLRWLGLASASGIISGLILAGIRLEGREGGGSRVLLRRMVAIESFVSFSLGIFTLAMCVSTAARDFLCSILGSDNTYIYILQQSHKIIQNLLLHLYFVPAAAPINNPFNGPILLTRSKPKLLPQTTGPEPAE